MIAPLLCTTSYEREYTLIEPAQCSNLQGLCRVAFRLDQQHDFAARVHPRQPVAKRANGVVNVVEVVNSKLDGVPRAAASVDARAAMDRPHADGLAEVVGQAIPGPGFRIVFF
jgi:hypothetical protein